MFSDVGFIGSVENSANLWLQS